MPPRLVPRDKEILFALGTLAPVVAEDIGRLCFPTTAAKERTSRSTTRLRLSKLCNLGLVRRLTTGNLADPTYYSLTPKGRDWLVEESRVEPSKMRVMTGLSHVSLDHHRMLTSLRISFVLAAKAHQDVMLDRFVPERELRPLAHDARLPICPDALLVLGRRGTDRRVAWAIEADLGGERAGVLRKKLAGYVDLRAAGQLFGVSSWAMLVVVPTVRRANSLRPLIAESGAGAWSAIAPIGELTEETVLSRVWLHVGSGAVVSLPAALGLAATATTPRDAVPRGSRYPRQGIGE